MSLQEGPDSADVLTVGGRTLLLGLRRQLAVKAESPNVTPPLSSEPPEGPHSAQTEGRRRISLGNGLEDAASRCGFRKLSSYIPHPRLPSDHEHS